jgi:hypothetical protein
VIKGILKYELSGVLGQKGGGVVGAEVKEKAGNRAEQARLSQLSKTEHQQFVFITSPFPELSSHIKDFLVKCRLVTNCETLRVIRVKSLCSGCHRHLELVHRPLSTEPGE